MDGSAVGDEFKGYIFKITGGNDKQGFPMKQGVITPQRVKLLLSDGHSCYRARRTGERKRKSVRGCIVAMDLAVLALAIIKQGEKDIPGITDTVAPKRLGPKRATKIRRFFGLSKDDDVRFNTSSRASGFTEERFIILMKFPGDRFANLWFVEPWSRRRIRRATSRKERSHTQKHRRSSASSHPSDCSTDDISRP